MGLFSRSLWLGDDGGSWAIEEIFKNPMTFDETKFASEMMQYYKDKPEENLKTYIASLIYGVKRMRVEAGARPQEVHIRITCEGGCSKCSTAPRAENQ